MYNRPFTPAIYNKYPDLDRVILYLSINAIDITDVADVSISFADDSCVISLFMRETGRKNISINFVSEGLTLYRDDTIVCLVNSKHSRPSYTNLQVMPHAICVKAMSPAAAIERPNLYMGAVAAAEPDNSSDGTQAIDQERGIMAINGVKPNDDGNIDIISKSGGIRIVVT